MNVQAQHQDFHFQITQIQRNILDENFEKSLFSLDSLNSFFAKSKSRKAIVNSLYGQLYLAKKEDEKALKYIKKAIKESASDTDEAKAYAYYMMSKYHQSLNENDNALENAFKALSFAEKTDNAQLLGDISYVFYGSYALLKKPLKTDEYAQKALDYYTKAKNESYISLANSAKAVAVRYRFEMNDEKAYKDSVSYYLYEAIRSSQQSPYSRKIQALSSLNIANYYMRQLIYGQEEIKKLGLSNRAIKDSIYLYISQLNKVSTSATYYGRRAMGNALVIEGMVEMNENHYQKAEDLMEKALEIFKKDETKNRRKLFNTAMALKDLSIKQNNPQKAFEYLQLQYDYNNLIFNEQQNNKIKALEAKYENEKIKQDLRFAKQKNNAKQIQIYLIALLLLLTFVIIFFIIRNHRHKMSINQQQILLLDKEKKEALNTIKLEEEKYARLLAERKLLEIEKEKISKRAMVNTVQIERKNKVLKEIETQLNQNDTQLSKISKTLKIEKYTEKQMFSNVDDFHEINPHFFEKLKERNAKLTSLDLKYCAYIYLGLSNKNIASNLNVETKSVRMTKYRIKKKLLLSKEESLENYLENLA